MYPPFLPINASIRLVLLINFLMNDDYLYPLPKVLNFRLSHRDG